MCLRGRGGPQAAQTVKNNNNNNNYNEVFPAETVKCWWMCQEQPEEDEQQRPQSDDEVWMCQTDSLSLLLRVKRGSPPSAAGREREGLFSWWQLKKKRCILGRFATRLYGCLCLCPAYLCWDLFAFSDAWGEIPDVTRTHTPSVSLPLWYVYRHTPVELNRTLNCVPLPSSGAGDTKTSKHVRTLPEDKISSRNYVRAARLCLLASLCLTSLRSCVKCDGSLRLRTWDISIFTILQRASSPELVVVARRSGMRQRRTSCTFGMHLHVWLL